jgi:hypothetical protein
VLRRVPPGFLRALPLVLAAVLFGVVGSSGHSWSAEPAGSVGQTGSAEPAGSGAPGAEIPLWDALIEVTDGAVTVTVGDTTLVYVDGLGWLADLVAPPPRVLDGVAWVVPAVAAALGLLPEQSGRPPSGDAAPPSVDGAPPSAGGAPPSVDGAPPSAGGGQARLVGVRISGEVDMRVVLDLEGLEVDALRGVGTVGRVEAGDALRLELPHVALPATLPATAGVIDLTWQQGVRRPSLALSGGGFAYDVFALAHPTRLVIDLLPDRDGVPASGERVEALGPGVVYRTFRAQGSGGPSRVHVLEVAPGAGQWRVVGAPDEAQPTLRWADGGFVAINGGYFEPATRTAIGLLVVDGVWLSPPSRGRAVIGFGPDGVVIDRVQVRTGLWLDERLALSLDHELAEQVAVHATPGAWAGTGRMGALTVDASGVITANRVGPVRVPDDGRVIVYPPELRVAALAEPGTSVRTAVRLRPASLERVSHAVEAGPLLVQGGRAAFAPELEAFARGVRILDEVTQQAAIGVTGDGTVLLVAAEAMVAADLVPLMLDLGAVDAMRLDSGGSTTLVADGRVLNRLTERAVANAIVWLPEAER